MFSLKKKRLGLPTAADALPGRADRMRVAARHFVNGHPLEPPFPAGLQTAMFGLGCFWGAERKFWTASGVYSTSVGYAGGLTPNPTYEEVCSGMTGHAEVVLVVFDPRQVGYDDLLRVFWESHDPTQGMRQGNDVGTQYRSVIYWRDESQRTTAQRSAEAYGSATGGRGLRRTDDGNIAGAGVLLRRGLSPAIPRKEPRGLLRDWWLWGHLWSRRVSGWPGALRRQFRDAARAALLSPRPGDRAARVAGSIPRPRVPPDPRIRDARAPVTAGRSGCARNAAAARARCRA